MEGLILRYTLESRPSRRALARRDGLIDLGHLPDRIRQIAGFWGGATMDTGAIYQVAQTDGFVTDIAVLRAEIIRIHDPKVRDELLGWLESRVPR
jgi:hypothetical protein